MIERCLLIWQIRYRDVWFNAYITFVSLPRLPDIIRDPPQAIGLPTSPRRAGDTAR